MSVIVNCIVCGNPFSASNRNAKFCGRECEYMYDNEIRRKKHRMEAAQKRKNAGKKKVKTIEEWNAEARAAGMSYGQYRAMVEMKNGRTENI